MPVDAVIDNIDDFIAYLQKYNFEFVLLSHFKPKDQYGGTCGYYALGNLIEYWNHVNSEFPYYPPRKREQKHTSVSLRKIGKKYTQHIGAIYDVNIFKKITDEIGYESAIHIFNSEEAFSLLAKNALDQGVPVILPMDNSHHQNHKLTSMSGGFHAHHISLMGYVIDSSGINFISISHGKYYYTSSQVLFNSNHNLFIQSANNYLKEEKGKDWTEIENIEDYPDKRTVSYKSVDLRYLRNHLVLVQPIQSEKITNISLRPQAKDIVLQNKSILHFALQCDHLKIFETLDISFTKVDQQGKNIVHNIAQYNAVTILNKLLLMGHSINPPDLNQQTPLHIAAKYDSIDIVTFYFQNKINLNLKDKSNKTPLHYAAQHNSIETAQFLCRNGADVNAKDIDGKTPLHYAALADNPLLIAILLENKADMYALDKYGMSPLHCAAQTNQTDAIRMFHTKFVDINSLNILGETPLTVAIKHGKLSAFKTLIEHGANLEYSGEYILENGEYVNGYTPLQAAILWKAKQMTEILLQKGTNPYIGSPPPLYYAIDSNNYDFVEMLVKYGTNPNLIFHDGQTAFDVAKKRAEYFRDNRILQFLLPLSNVYSVHSISQTEMKRESVMCSIVDGEPIVPDDTKVKNGRKRFGIFPAKESERKKSKIEMKQLKYAK